MRFLMKVNIKDLFDKLDPKEYKDIKIENNSEVNPNLDNIKKCVFENIDKQEILQNSSNKKRNKKFKRSFRGAWVAAMIICLTCTTAFAFSNIDFFKEIFGKDAEIVEKNIQDVVATATDGEIIFTVESLLSDGSQNYFVVSLEKKNNEEIGKILPVMSFVTPTTLNTRGITSYHINRIDNLNNSKNKGYYLFTLSTTANLIGDNIKLSLEGIKDENSGKEKIFKKELTVSFDINNNNSLKTIYIENPQIINNKYYNTKYCVTEINFSNLGMNIKGKEIEASYSIPTPKIELKYKDGEIKELTPWHTDSDFSNAGFAYSRTGENEFTNVVWFNKLVDTNTIESIIVAEEEFKIK